MKKIGHYIESVLKILGIMVGLIVAMYILFSWGICPMVL